MNLHFGFTNVHIKVKVLNFSIECAINGTKNHESHMLSHIVIRYLPEFKKNYMRNPFSSIVRLRTGFRYASHNCRLLHLLTLYG